MSVIFNPPYPAGMLNGMLHDIDDRPAAEQFNERYAHGGGWHPFGGDKWSLEKQENGTYHLLYPEDPPMKEVARAELRDELIILFECEMVAIIQKDGTFEVSRMD